MHQIVDLIILFAKMKGFWVFFVLLWCSYVTAQDIHFSQFHVSPILQNPANTGYFNCDYRFTGIYKNQWRSVTVPYQTFASSFDMRFVRGKGTKDIAGLGLNFFNDKAGDADFSHTNVGLAGAFHKNLDRFGMNYLGAGMFLSYGTGSIDFNKLRFGNQLPLCPTCPLQPSTQTPPQGFGYADASAGIEYNFIPQTRDNHIQVGAAIFHLNQPKKTFYDNSDSRIPRKYVIHASGQIKLNSKVDIFPKTNISFQGTNKEILIGTFTRVDLDKYKNSKYGVYLGTWVRVGDAFILVYRMDIDQVSFAFSYDINTSSLKPASAARGGPEFSVIYIGCLPQRNSKSVYCPRF